MVRISKYREKWLFPRNKNYWETCKEKFRKQENFTEIARNHSIKLAVVNMYHSPQCTAFNTPTAAVVCRSKPCPIWSAWALVLSSKSISRGSLVRGRYCRFFISLVVLFYKITYTERGEGLKLFSNIYTDVQRLNCRHITQTKGNFK